MYVPTATIEDLKTEFLKYKPEDVLRRCREWSLKLSGQRIPMQVFIPQHVDRRGIAHTINVAPYSIALIARLSLLAGSRLAIHKLTSDSFLRLLCVVSELYEPITDPIQFFIQTAYEQFWYQNLIGRVIPRTLLMYRDSCHQLQNPKFDIPGEFQHCFGISIEDYAAIGFAFFAAAIRKNEPVVRLPFRVESQQFAQRLTPDKTEAFLAFNAANQDKFRDTAKSLAPSGTGDGRYDFNPLFKYPLIDLGSNSFIAPLPDLIIWRIYHGPFMELRDVHMKDSAKENPFAAFFGEVFQQYVGLLLKNTFPEQVFAEVAYGVPEKRSPDWIVRVGDRGIAIECTNSALTLPAKTLPTTEQVRTEVKNKYVNKVRNLPEKIGELSKPSSPYFKELSGISRWHYLLVYREPLHPNELFRRKFFDIAEGMPALYHIMDIEGFESLLSLDPHNICRALEEKEADSERARADFHHFLVGISKSTGIKLRNSLLERASEEFFTNIGVRRREDDTGTTDMR